MCRYGASAAAVRAAGAKYQKGFPASHGNQASHISPRPSFANQFAMMKQAGERQQHFSAPPTPNFAKPKFVAAHALPMSPMTRPPMSPMSSGAANTWSMPNDAYASKPVPSAEGHATQPFVPSARFEGARAGFVFTNGNAGLGYYRDATAAGSTRNAGSDARPASDPSHDLSEEGSLTSSMLKSVSFEPGLPPPTAGSTDPRKYHDRAVAEIMQRKAMSGMAAPPPPQNQHMHQQYARPTPTLQNVYRM